MPLPCNKGELESADLSHWIGAGLQREGSYPGNKTQAESLYHRKKDFQKAKTF